MIQSVGADFGAVADFEFAAAAGRGFLTEGEGLLAVGPNAPPRGLDADCGNTATTFPVATSFLSSRHTSICSASITDSPCHRRARPTYSTCPEVVEPESESAEMCAGPEPRFIAPGCPAER